MTWSRTNQLIARAAATLGVRCESLTAEHSDFLLRLKGPSGPVVVSKTRSPFLTVVAQTLVNNKHVSRTLLAEDGIPVVPSLLVDEQTDSRDPRLDDWLKRHRRLVVKPNWGNRARGITVGIDDRARLWAAIERARDVDLDEEALVEPELPGTNLRIAVIGGRYEAAVEIQRPVLQGDGRSSPRALIDRLNEDPRRGSWRAPALLPLDRIELDDDLAEGLTLMGASPDAVLQAGTSVELLSDEAETIDRTDMVHPEWRALACEACEHMRVDVGGVDLRGPLQSFAEPPSASFAAAGVGVLEINVLPALHLHALPTQGRGREVFEAFVAYCVGS